jgi:hypothetical protein
MPSTEDSIQALVNQPSERLNVELKPWLDLSAKWGQHLLAKSLLALRNQDGGFLVIGFEDDGLPSPTKEGVDVRQIYHVDKIQEIASRYASKPFSISVHFRERDGIDHPIVQVESGIRTPVACKADLFADKGSTKLLSVNDIYVRTLNSNGIASSSKIKAGDLDDVVERCFQNREADHVAFLSKLIRSLPKSEQAIFLSILGGQLLTERKPPGELETKILDTGRQRFFEVAAKRKADVTGLGFLEGALKISGPLKQQRASTEFLQFLDSANPSLTGWPIWLISQSFANPLSRPYTHQNTWEQFLETSGFNGNHLDFMVFNPNGEFYFRRAFEDDSRRANMSGNAPRTVEPVIQLLRVAESLAVGKAFASVLSSEKENAKLLFAFRWSGLEDRKLIGWNHPELDIGTNSASHEDTVLSFVDLTTTANEQEIAEKTKEALDSLTTAFGGYELHRAFVEGRVSRLLQRKL